MEKVNCLITLSNNENTTNDYLTVHHDPDKKRSFMRKKIKQQLLIIMKQIH